MCAYGVRMVTNTPRAVAEAIASQMREKGLTQAGLAESSGLGRMTLSRRLRSGAFTVPELEAVVRTLGHASVSAFYASIEEAA